MQIPLQITMRGFPHSDAVESMIRQKASKLEEFYQPILGCRVVVDLPHKHQHQGKSFNVRLDITVPGQGLLINRELAEDVNVALRDAFDAARRKLEDYARKQRRDVKAHAQPFHGRVIRLNAEEGYGFVETDDGKELYFSRDNVVTPDFDRLAVGAIVQFLEDVGAEGLQAKRVSVGKHGGVQ